MFTSNCNCSRLLLWSSICNIWVLSDFSWDVRIYWDLFNISIDVLEDGSLYHQVCRWHQIRGTVNMYKGMIAVQRSCMGWRTGPRRTLWNAMPSTEKGRSPCNNAHKDDLAWDLLCWEGPGSIGREQAELEPAECPGSWAAQQCPGPY